MLSNGIKYLDVPYVAHTLEADGPEELVINCDEVDCTTLVEYIRQVLIAGGVASSRLFRELVTQRTAKRQPDLRVHFGRPEYSGDNAVGRGAHWRKKMARTANAEGR